MSIGLTSIAAAVLTASPALAASGTAATSGSYAFAAKLQIGNGESARACSGALIDASWVVTAASCFANGATAPVAGKPVQQTIATIGRTDLSATSGGHVSEVVQITPHAQRDLVMARLATPAAGVAPVAVATTSSATGDTLKAAGYGRTNTEWVPNKLHTASFAADTVGAADITLTAKSMGDSVCRGDAGAPVLRESGGTVQLVGVITKTSHGGCLEEKQEMNVAAATRVDDLTLASSLAPGQLLKPGGMLVSAAGALTMRPDGNLAITSNVGETIWSTGTSGAGSFARLEANGNLVVRNAADTATLWESKTSAAGGKLVLTDRGNLVVYNAQQQSVWSSNTVVRHDVNGDGRSDIGAWYAYPKPAVSDAMYTFLAKPKEGTTEAGVLGAPVKSYTSSTDKWNEAAMKNVAGDFNGDGRADMVTLHGNSNASVTAYVALGQADGTFADPVQAWAALPGGEFHISYMTPQAGDFNGDGRDDMAVWSANAATGETKLFTFTSKPSGTFNTPFASWKAPANSWARSSTKFVTGDFNGDGREELSVFYKQGTQGLKTYVFGTLPNGGFSDPGLPWWESAAWDWDNAIPQAGDFDGDGHDDVLVWYSYDDGADRTSTMLFEKVDGKNKFGSAKVTLDGAKNYDVARIKMVTGDYNGDGRDDLAIMNHRADDKVQMITWTAKSDAMFNGGLAGWTSNAGAWSFSTTKLFSSYN